VPKGLRRYYGAEDLHFITCSCYQRKPWLDNDERRDLFLKILEEVRKEHRFVVRAAGRDTVDGDAECKTAFCAESCAQAQAAASSRHPPLAENAKSGAPRIPDVHLAAALLRFQCLDGAEANRKAALHAPESGNAGIGPGAGALALE